MHAEEREKILAMMAAVLLAPKFDPLLFGQKQENELLHDPAVESAIRTARVICDAVEDEEERHDSVVFENPGERKEQPEAVGRATRQLDRMGRTQERRKTG